MSYVIKILDSAGNDFDDILEYLEQFYPNTPAKFVKALSEKLPRLKDNPFMYEAYPDHPAFRRMAVLGYNVFYKVDEDAEVIEIYRILHGSRDVKKILK